VIRHFIVLALLVTGCATKSDAASCDTKEFSGGVLSDCGSSVTFQPSGANLAVSYMVVNPGAAPLRVRASGLLVECRATQVPEGQWVICVDGRSQLERTAPNEPVATR